VCDRGASEDQLLDKMFFICQALGKEHAMVPTFFFNSASPTMTGTGAQNFSLSLFSAPQKGYIVAGLRAVDPLEGHPSLPH